MGETTSRFRRVLSWFCSFRFSWRLFWRLSMYALAIIARLGLVSYSSYHDEQFEVKFTDIDYCVFTDAAKKVLDGRSVYDRHTYRYTPFLAYILIPNITMRPDFGKLLFSFCDVITGFMIESTLDRESLLLPALWLFNPFVMSISARGNADCMICLFVIATMFCLKKRAVSLAAIFYGISVHFKLYPIIYIMPIMLHLYSDAAKEINSWMMFLRKFFRVFVLGINRDHFKFALISASIFLYSSYMAFKKYGLEYIYESYAYHFFRQDHRHNFSLFFNQMYYVVDLEKSMNPLISFIPQMLCVFIFGAVGLKDVEIAVFLQTIAFVSLNKVCTCQYYLWWICLMPLVLAKINLSWQRVLVLFTTILVFAASNALWLFFAYLLEIKGYSTFDLLLYSSTMFVLSQMTIGWVILQQIFSSAKEKQHSD